MKELFNSDISSISYKELLGIVNSLSEESFNNGLEIQDVANNLKSDKRKNVYTLGIRLEGKLLRRKEEIARVRVMYDFDNSFGNYEYIAGIDEVGRGPLAGPIVAAAVILKNKESVDDFMILGLNDSKKISSEKRELLYDIIIKNALSYKIALIENEIIDQDGIGHCNNRVFIEACNGLSIKPDLVLSDGYPIKNYNVNNKAVIKGDTKSASIAAASIIAKVFRDRLMRDYSNIYPQYGFEKHVGYGTKEHIEAIKRYGIIPLHRKSFLRALID